MPEYVIQIAHAVEKEIEKLPHPVLQRVSQKIDQLAFNPRPAGCGKLGAARNRWRMRVGDYRIVYSVDDTKRLIDIVRVRHRRDVYE